MTPKTFSRTSSHPMQMCQRAQAALDRCAKGERPEVDALDLRVFQEQDAYMRRQREMLARHTAQRTFDDLERAQLIAAVEAAGPAEVPSGAVSGGLHSTSDAFLSNLSCGALVVP